MDLRPVLSICVLDEIIFAKAAYPGYHHSFRLRCDQVDLVFSNDFEFHTLEFPKFTPSSDNIGSLPAEEKWLYLLRHAETMDADQLAALLVDPPYQEAKLEKVDDHRPIQTSNCFDETSVAAVHLRT